MRTGVIFIEGKPGAGKSFKGTEELIRQIVEHRRPVYSNLPLRDRPLRRYLTRKAGKDAFLKLWTPLTEQHFHAHVSRSVRIDAAFASWRQRSEGLGYKNHTRDAFDRWYFENHPADRPITRGPEANWIQSGACLILDEVHLWTPQTGTQKNTDLLSYASMHRHHHHLIYLLTQDTMQAAIELRRQCIEVIVVDDASSIKIFDQFSLSTLGLRNKIARYAHYSKENYEVARSTNRRGASPDKVEIRWLPFNSHIFSLYDSYGRTGISRRRQHKMLVQQAQEVGVAPPKSKSITHKKIRPKRLRGRIWRAGFWFARTSFLLGTGVVLGISVRDQQPEVLPKEDGPLFEEQTYSPPSSPEAIGSDWLRLDARTYRLRDIVNDDYLLFQIDHQAGYAVLVHRDAGPSWLLVPGRQTSTLGPTPDFMARIRSELGRRSTLLPSDAPSPFAGTPGSDNTGHDPFLGNDSG